MGETPQILQVRPVSAAGRGLAFDTFQKEGTWHGGPSVFLDWSWQWVGGCWAPARPAREAATGTPMRTPTRTLTPTPTVAWTSTATGRAWGMAAPQMTVT